MKRDSDLYRELLLDIEKNEDPDTRGTYTVDFDDFDHSKGEICRHLELLDEAGLLVASVDESGRYLTANVRRITHEGHDFLDNVREEDIYKKAKAKVKDVAGAVSPTMLKIAAEQILKSQLGA